MEVSEATIPVLKTRKYEGQIPRYISVKDVDIEYDQIGEVHQVHTTAHFLSDIGEFSKQFIIRYFDSSYHYTLEMTKYRRLQARLSPFDMIKPVEILFHDEESQVILYQKPEGVKLKDINMSEDTYFYLLGIIFAQLQGTESSQLQLENLQNKAFYLFDRLPFKEEAKNQIWSYIINKFDLLLNSQAGFEPLTRFDIGNLRVTSDVGNITKESIVNGDAMQIEVLPSLVTTVQKDRMEDIADLIALNSFHEFQQSIGVKSTVTSFKLLLQGFNQSFKQTSGYSLDLVYPRGLSIELHILLKVWMYCMEKINTGELINETLLTQYSLHLLENSPFTM